MAEDSVEVSFEMLKEKALALDQLVSKAGFTNKRQFMNFAFSLAEWVVNERHNDRRVGSKTNDDVFVNWLFQCPIEIGFKRLGYTNNPGKLRGTIVPLCYYTFTYQD